MVLLTVFLVAVFITACESSSVENNDVDHNDKVADAENDSNGGANKSNNNNADENSEEAAEKNDITNNVDEASGVSTNQDNNVSEGSNDDGGNDLLTEYSSEEIEFARVWLQLGANQDIDQLYAERISAGEPLNPDDETSLDYPEDVVQLSGSRLIDGVVTYSSNGDGTVNVYNVPKRWDGKNPAGEDTYKKIIESTKQESIDVWQDEQVEALIKKLKIDS
nr:hypothetical protein [Lentibacillus saliphilus]